MVQDSQILHSTIDIFQQFDVIPELVFTYQQEPESAYQSEFQTYLDR